MAMSEPAPLILTLALDERSFAFFDSLRRRHFPTNRNFISAHLTLFHHLPRGKLDAITGELAARAAAQPPLALEVTGLRSLGRGVAYTLASPALASLRQALAQDWSNWLTPQDRQKHQPHVTVQNKVEPADARALLDELAGAFRPFTATGEGLDIWWYRGGPWEKARHFPFR